MIPAIILIGIGVLFLLSNLHVFYFQDWWRYWPGILIAVGVIKLVDAQSNPGRVGGGVLLIVGGIFLGQSLGYFRVADLWPLILIGVGLLLLIDRTLLVGNVGNWSKFAEKIQAKSAGHEAAVFGGGKRQFNGRDFTGGKFDCVFGGFEIDLRGANMIGDSAVLEINAVFGGAGVRIPSTWLADIRGTGVFGGFSDDTVAPRLDTPGLKRLIIKGGAVFGGVNIKN